ncbi:MAG: hypothetical protein HON76_03935 [Candidatus Scalindua sp.]|jgi:hemerythrin-like domain-containing protein|nr:hypothetical protein [Candidatus Scalindua sp.]MBT5306995.1 hypothetical protein [Candidatus Scalindua sp.]MBT6045669.1 hypothetical protein [Candidatus Scalindua sp.]MBT6225844.1 hypothetical protein [Candidatus Scalindua sp.]MBT6561659.1 hypothetical protein [Candidatus Scalindua sp.]
MLKLIEEFKKEHSFIIDTLNRSRKLGIGTEESQNAILSVKDIILDHIKMEDKEFYPVLRETAKSNQKLKNLLAEFDKDMKEISRYFIEFFDNNSVITGSDLAMELENFTAILERRILREETFLFAEFEKFNQ